MKLGALLPLLALLVPARSWAQQFPTSDPSFSRPEPSLAPEEDVFGVPGQMAITGDFDIDLRYVTQSLNNFSSSGPDITVVPSVMFFLAPRLAVGGLAGFHHEADESISLSSFIFGPTGSYNIPISPRASIFPTVGLTYTWSKTSRGTAGGRDTDSGYSFGLLLKAPLLYHPFPHVFVGFGPIIVLDLVSKVDDMDYPRTRSFGLTLDLGFWL